MGEKIVHTAGRSRLGEFAPMFNVTFERDAETTGIYIMPKVHLPLLQCGYRECQIRWKLF